MRYRRGTWGSDEENSSNWREFENIIKTLGNEAENGKLGGSEIWLAINNKTVESCLYRGNSGAEKLYHLVLRLKVSEHEHGAVIKVTHILG